MQTEDNGNVVCEFYQRRKEAIMAIMSDDVKKLFESAENMVLCTATKDGQPNGAAIGMKAVIDDETVYISDQFFNKTLQNIKENAKVAVAFWTGHDAFQIHGIASYTDEGDAFIAQKEKVDGAFASMGLPIRAKGGCFIHVDEVFQMAAGSDAGKKLA